MALLLNRPEDGDTEWLADYRSSGGYEALAKARAGSQEEVIRLLLDSGLRGRGGAGFPVARKWELGLAAAAEKKHVVVNGGEHEPGSRKDRFLVAKMPHRVLEGAAICAFATGATSIVLYLIEDMVDAIESARRAIEEATTAGLFPGVDLRIALAPTTYVAGEETAALEVIEGRKPWPRKKPPYPGQAGLYGQPTTVQNVETLAWVPGIVKNGASWFSPGAMLCTLDESFARPGIVEVPLGTTLRDLVEKYGGGTRGGRPVKAILPALSSAFLKGSALDTPMTHEAMRAAGSNLGCGGFSVVEEGACIVERAAKIADFFKASQCGQCPPCRMETATIAAVFAKAAAGEAGEYAAQVEKIAAFTKGKGNCSLIEMAASPALSALRLFPEDFEAHAKTGRCPA
ncbi:MAG: NADH-ubiquinone oxidoreductase-F iron-sulfur binding region domain-containing protein [Polyangiaceae bacterium]